ncbi:MAG: 2-C-methyl-D-erythritol 2,4-cyclodiphosphate synthase [Chlamydiae bacterium RIFCSPHIGHO2_12_FULL_27_8]|nr:MAG: 2-C-methyl-D-erythritol 2,4-cyclodiphosphate synthase [Chlamydiae bacterium RIFCSPHIGHO2_12_FULL_27_8]OGN66898.1 MAG: 2-C-methyl-D-erythritol 2,4-cyclodiphosphate synthase [Chlamydiae bacterium RIFCSPLOWO2_01_FULL_28_7]
MENFSTFVTGIGRDSHRFLKNGNKKPLILGGMLFDDIEGLAADSDGDVILHSICNAITSITHVPILGDIAIELCKKDGITDSKVYVQKALETLKNCKILHVAFTIEAKKPKIQPKILELRKSISNILNIDISQVGITATSGDGLTNFGLGEGISVFCILSIQKF